MNLHPNFIIICEKAFLTAGNNNLNMVGIFTQINSENFPVKYPHFALVVNINVQKFGSHNLEAQILDPNGMKITDATLPVSISTSPFQVISNFENLSFPIPGMYEIKVLLDEEYIGSCKIDLRAIVHKSTGLA